MKICSNKPTGLFEICLAYILFAPIVFFIFSYFAGQSLGLLASILIPLSCIVLLYRSHAPLKLKELFSSTEIETALFFVAFFLFALKACLLWPDFIAMGERLRDYALLAAVSDSPVDAREPWMAGENLNYYLYWYRFAAYWSTIMGISVWNSYHLLAAFSFSIFASAVFRLLRAYLSLPSLLSGLIAILIATGSNLDGIISAFSGSTDWWGPSRVIKGAINEFPAWSFLLGDLHPHFLNLVMTPLLLCFALAIANCSFKHSSKIILILLLFIMSAALYYNSNAWEVPMAGITFGFAIVLTFYGFRKDLYSKLSELLSPGSLDADRAGFWVILTMIILSMLSLLISSGNIQPADYPWRLVREPVQDSTLHELLMHWGIPFFSLLLALFLRLNSASLASLAACFLMALSIAYQSSVFTILALTIWVTAEALRELNAGQSATDKIRISLLYTLGISSLVLIALGELIYLDDPYGGENDRMNTIFKIYSASWSPFHIFAFSLLIRNLSELGVLRLVIPYAFFISATLPAFFIHTITLRKNWAPSMEGLASIEQQFPGSADAIRFLRQQPRQTVLESQGNPYSYTTHVATLGGHDSYLGWANHVGLLTGKHDEVGRREKITDQIYRESECSKIKELLQKEKIDLIVAGALEKQKYGPTASSSFSCLSAAFDNQSYSIFSAK